METQASSIGGKSIDGGIDARAAASMEVPAREVLVADVGQRDVLMRSVAQLSSLLMVLSATPRVLEVLPESARTDVLCLACDLAARANSLLEGTAAFS